MRYWKGMKFVMETTEVFLTNIKGYETSNHFTAVYPDGKVVVNMGFPWNGNSGPLPDFDCTKRASGLHDALCDLVNEGKLPVELQPMIDQEYYNYCVKDGMWPPLARQVLVAIRYYQTKQGDRLVNRKVYTVGEDNNV